MSTLTRLVNNTIYCTLCRYFSYTLITTELSSEHTRLDLSTKQLSRRALSYDLLSNCRIEPRTELLLVRLLVHVKPVRQLTHVFCYVVTPVDYINKQTFIGL